MNNSAIAQGGVMFAYLLGRAVIQNSSFIGN